MRRRAAAAEHGGKEGPGSVGREGGAGGTPSLCFGIRSLFADERGRAQLEALRDTLEKMAAQAGTSMAEEKAGAPAAAPALARRAFLFPLRVARLRALLLLSVRQGPPCPPPAGTNLAGAHAARAAGAGPRVRAAGRRAARELWRGFMLRAQGERRHDAWAAPVHGAAHD